MGRLAKCRGGALYVYTGGLGIVGPGTTNIDYKAGSAREQNGTCMMVGRAVGSELSSPTCSRKSTADGKPWSVAHEWSL